VILPQFNALDKTIKVLFPKSIKFFKESDDYATFLKGMWDMYG